MPFPDGSRVEVRATAALPWLGGEVVGQDAFCYRVDLDAPITADDWSGMSRRYGGSDPLDWVHVHKASEILPPADALIRAEGG